MNRDEAIKILKRRRERIADHLENLRQSMNAPALIATCVLEEEDAALEVAIKEIEGQV